jgi:uncharacterized protein YqgC (DUF456 family)
MGFRLDNILFEKCYNLGFNELKKTMVLFQMLIIILSFIGFCVYVGLIGRKREIGFLTPFLGSLISMIIGFRFIGLPSTFKDTGSSEGGIFVLFLSAITGPLITLALTLLSERKE